MIPSVRVLCFAFCISLTNFAAAQSANQLWAIRYNAPANYVDIPFAVAIDRSGHAIVTGQSYGTSAEFYTVKYSSHDGTAQWQQRYGSALHAGESARTIAVDPNGNVVVAGISNQGATGESILMAKYSANGTQAWMQTFNTAGNHNDWPTRVIMDQQGNVIIVGYVGNGDWFVAKYAGANGQQLWQRTYDNGSLDVAGSVAVDSTGNVIATGYLTATNGNDIYTVKYAGADGATIWQKQFDGPVHRSDAAHTVLVDSADNVFIVGNSERNSSFDSDILVLKYAKTDGAQIWSIRSPTTATYRSRAGALDKAGNVLVTGTFMGAQGSTDLYTAKYAASNGAVLWEKTYNGSANGTDTGICIAADENDNVVVAGTSPGIGTNSDIYVAKYAAANGNLFWEKRYNGPANNNDNVDQGPEALAVGPGCVVVTGASHNGSNFDYATIKYVDAPTPVTLAVDLRMQSSARLNENVSTNGFATQAWFEYGTSPTLAGASATPAVSISSSLVGATVSYTVSGLIPGTTYYHRAVTSGNTNTSRGAILSFTTLPNSAPAQGTMTIDRPSPIRGGSELTVTFANWTDEHTPLTYGIFFDNEEISAPDGEFAILITVPPIDGVHTLKGRIADSYGLAAEVTKQITVDAIPPKLNSVRIASNNANPSFAKLGDTIVLSLDSSEPIAISSLEIAGKLSAVAGGGTQWQGTIPVDATLANGTASISIVYADAVGNNGEVGTTTTNSSGVVIDLAPPVVELNGPTLFILEAATPYVEPGAAAADLIAGNVSGTIQISGSVNHALPGDYSLGYSAKDLAGNIGTAVRLVRVVDTTAPALSGTFSPLGLVTGPAGNVPIPDYLPQTVSSDAVGVVSVTQFPPAGSLLVAGTTAVTITAADAAGNSSTAGFEVIVSDGTKPDISTPVGGFAPATLTTGADGTVALVDYAVQAVTSDNVGVTAVTQLPAPGTLLVFGTTTITLTAHDAAGNTRDLSFDVPVLDGTNPTIAAPLENFAPLGITTGVDGTVALPDYTAQAVTGDNVAVTTVTQIPVPGSPRLAGVTTVTLTAHDAAGNMKDVSFDVTVADGTKPEIAAPVDGFAPLIITAENDGTAELPAYTLQAVTSDNVAVTSVTQVPAPGDVRLFGKTTVTLTAHDAAGNTRDTSFDIFVVLDNPLLNTLATTGGAVPGAGVDARVPADAIFTSVGIPAMDDLRGVAFLGKWKSAAGLGAGIFAGNPPALVVAAGEDAPGVAGAKFKTLNDPLLALGGGVAFGATVTGGGVKAANDFGVWMITGGVPALVLREGAQVPGLAAGLLLKSVTGLSLRDGELLATITLAPLKGVVTAANDSALLRITPAGATVLLREGALFDPGGGNPTATIKSINALVPAQGSPAHGRSQADGSALARITLADKRAAIVQVIADGTTNARLVTGDAVPSVGTTAFWKSPGLPAIEPGGNAAVLKAVIAVQTVPGAIPAVTTKTDTALAFDNGSGLAIFAREGSTAPGAGDTTFASFLDPLVNDSDDVAFIATLAAKGITAKNNTGLWWGAPGAPALLARAGSPAPDANGTPTTALWSRFISLALPSGEDAGPVFVAGLTGPGVTAKNNLGVWAVDSTGLLRGLLRTGDLVDGKPVIGINALTTVPGALGASRGYNARGAVVARVLFAKGGQSIVRIDIPEGKERVLSPTGD